MNPPTVQYAALRLRRAKRHAAEVARMGTAAPTLLLMLAREAVRLATEDYNHATSNDGKDI